MQQTRPPAARRGQNAPFPRYPVLLALAVILAVAVAAFIAGLLVGQGQGQQAPAPVPTVFTPAATTASVTLDAAVVKACTIKVTDTGTYSVSAAGTVRTTHTHKVACGHDYQKWERITSHSRTGAHYTEDLYRNEADYPHYRQTETKDAWTAKGAHTHTYIVTTG